MPGDGAAPLSERAAAFVADVVAPNAPAAARGVGMRPRELVAEAGRRGLAGLLLPREHGGGGASHVEFAGFVERVATACASAAVVLDVHLSVASEPLLRFGTPAQHARYLPRLASGEWTGCFALTEPSSGSDAGSLRTRATRDGDGWRLSGTKAFITNAGDADVAVVMARTGEVAGARGISAFIVETAWPGVGAGAPLHKLGLRGSVTAELHLDDVRVPAENLLGDVGHGFRVAMSALDSGRIGISGQAVGIAQGALRAALAAARRRSGGASAGVVGGEAWLDGLDADVGALADMEAAVVASRLLTRYAAEVADGGAAMTRPAAIAKLVATDSCVAVASAAVSLCAPESADELHPASVRLRDAKACQLYEGTNQVQRMVIARELLRRR